MKKSFAFLIGGAAWILFCGLIGFELPLSPNPFSLTLTPPPSLGFKPPQREAPVSPLFSSLEESWRADRLLATAA